MNAKRNIDVIEDEISSYMLSHIQKDSDDSPRGSPLCNQYITFWNSVKVFVEEELEAGLCEVRAAGDGEGGWEALERW